MGVNDIHYLILVIESGDDKIVSMPFGLPLVIVIHVMYFVLAIFYGEELAASNILSYLRTSRPLSYSAVTCILRLNLLIACVLDMSADT